MNIKEAKKIIVSLSKPEKMPGFAYGVPAAECKTGAKLRLIPNSVCAGCYALKGNYARFPAIVQAQYKRLGQLFNPTWVDAMVSMIERENNPYFRWHDAGDIQSAQHLKNICDVARKTPSITHWIPTREHKIVNDFVNQGNTIPKNLIIRISATNIDGKPPKNASHTSTVHSSSKPIGFECVAPKQDGACLDCRACWNPSIKNISYKQH